MVLGGIDENGSKDFQKFSPPREPREHRQKLFEVTFLRVWILTKDLQ